METEHLALNLSSNRASFTSEDTIDFQTQDSDELLNLINSREAQVPEYGLHKYFMNIAILVSQHRRKVKHQAGACIVNSSNKIIGIGNYTHSETLKSELISLFKDKNRPKNDYLNHAEVNAIVNKKESNLESCTMYVTSFPCIECAKLIAHSGISKVVYIDDNCCQTLNENEFLAAKVLLDLAEVTMIKFV